ncbi:hypothetical protein FE257_009541 [Aspergillus nanangensis]|uniref:Uncharacterized protein n=1 Tax=Aspergillus nanangensis TaxID=2582783 RepID=A0AAD4CK18_ASPNN|nr:hypothetical protein FE257_009541 [Aspergillus nanangensis]
MGTTTNEASIYPGWNFRSMETSEGALAFMEESHDMGIEAVQRYALPDCPSMSAKQEFYPVQSSEFSTLFNVAFKTLLSKPSSKGEEGAKTSRSLSTYFPAVFNPDFNNAMSQRAQFIPAIAKSIDALLKFTKIAALQDKFAGLKVAPGILRQSQHAGDMKATIQAHFWLIAQKQLHRSGSPCALNALDIVPVLHGNTHPLHDILFSESMSEEAGIRDYDEHEYISTDDEHPSSRSPSILSFNDDRIDMEKADQESLILDLDTMNPSGEDRSIEDPSNMLCTSCGNSVSDMHS